MNKENLKKIFLILLISAAVIISCFQNSILLYAVNTANNIPVPKYVFYLPAIIPIAAGIATSVIYLADFTYRQYKEKTKSECIKKAEEEHKKEIIAKHEKFRAEHLTKKESDVDFLRNEKERLTTTNVEKDNVKKLEKK